MTTRRQFVFAGALGAACGAVLGQGRRVPRVGVLHVGSAKEPAAVQRQPFERGLSELGWVPGSTVIIDYRYAEGDRSKLGPLADELVRAGVDVIVARADAAIHAARKATSTIPIVMSAYIGDPAVDGVVKNPARPGGNVTGIGNFLELDGKRLELLKDTFPHVRRIGVVSNPTLEGAKSAERMARLSEAAAALKLQVQVFEITRKEQIGDLFSAIGKARPDALLVRGDPEVLDPYRAEIAGHAAKLRIPAIYWWRFFVEAGGLMSYGNSIPGLHNRSATFVDRILKGAKASELPIEQPTKFELVVNLKTAKALGIEIPKAVTFRADHIIE
jgi:putative tryptophan/tyrosine transport system substrate-binding protein